jgi:general secretion pathway protein L
VSVLRIRCPLTPTPVECEWMLDDARGVTGVGALSDAPKHASRVELVVPASDVIITRTQLPPMARRGGGKALAYAVEDHTLGDPDNHHACWLGVAGTADVLAVMDRAALTGTLAAFERAGLSVDEAYSETLLLPRRAGEWSVFWDGHEGFVHTGDLDGAATDEGDARAPPMALHLMLKEAAAEGVEPAALAVYAPTPDAAPDLDAWQSALGLPVRFAGEWDWRLAPSARHARLALESRSRRVEQFVKRLKPAAWIAAAALLLHLGALAVDWALLSAEQRTLRSGMEQRFRAVFPDAVAVTDPALQMRRRLAEVRHAAGIADPDDFLPALARAASAVMSLPPGSLRAFSYESGALTVHLTGADETTLRAVVGSLADAGVTVIRRERATADGTVVLTLGGA